MSGEETIFDKVRRVGGRLTEYGVRYEAPDVYAGVVTRIGYVRTMAESVARAENAHADIKCVVVQRRVTFDPWAVSS